MRAASGGLDVDARGPRRRSHRPLTARANERLEMTEDVYHTPVLVDRVVAIVRDLPTGVIIDATVGGGGHATALLQSVPQIRVLGIDRDPAAREVAGSRLAPYGQRARIVAATFADLASVARANSDFVADAPVVGVLMDLGVSSRQLDDPARGFSFRFDAPLDMRMDPSSGETAAQLLEHISQEDLVNLLRDNGEGRFAKAIATALREQVPATTAELVATVERVVPIPARRRGNVATRVFQALRIAVNDEERELREGLDAAFDALSPGGALVVIAYHSGEDRAVKSFLHTLVTGGCQCPVDLGCVCGAVPKARVLRSSALLAHPDEIASNPRARSARLRVGWKLAS